MEEDWILRKILEYTSIIGFLRCIEESRAFGFVRESFLTKAISFHPKGRLVMRMISASRKRILFESFEHSFFSCFDLKPLPNLEIKFYPDFKRKIPLKELDI